MKRDFVFRVFVCIFFLLFFFYSVRTFSSVQNNGAEKYMCGKKKNLRIERVVQSQLDTIRADDEKNAIETFCIF